MTETSLPWVGTTTGDASLAPYSADQWSDMFRKLHLDNRTKNGVIRGYLNELACTGTSSPISVDTGGAFVDGIFYENSAIESFVLAAPAANPRIDRVVLRKSSANQTVRLTVITGVEAASPSPPAITQSDNVTWDLPLWKAWIDTAGNVTIFDEYNYAHSPLGFDVGLQQGRLSLLFDNGLPVEDEEPLTPNSTDAVNDTVTFAAEAPWNTGQAIQISATTNGLTQDQIYYVRTADNLTYSFHETLHDAKSNLNLVNITGNIEPSTLYSGAVYLTRYIGDSYDVYDSTYGWTRLRIPEDGILLDITDRATFVADYNFDVFAASDGTIEALVWTDDTTRATEIEHTDGIYLKDGDQTRRYLGTFRTTSTAGRVDDTKKKRFVWNYYNRKIRLGVNRDNTAHAYATGAYRYYNNDSTNKIEFVLGVSEGDIPSFCQMDDGDKRHILGMDIDASAAMSADYGIVKAMAGVSGLYAGGEGILPSDEVPEGYHYVAMLEYGDADASIGGGQIRLDLQS